MFLKILYIDSGEKQDNKLKELNPLIKQPPGLKEAVPLDPKRHSSQNNWDAYTKKHQLGPMSTNVSPHKASPELNQFHYQRTGGYNTPPPAMNYQMMNTGYPQQMYNQDPNLQYYQDQSNQFASMGHIQYAAVPVAYIAGYGSYSQPGYYIAQPPGPVYNLPPSNMQTPSPMKKTLAKKASQFKPNKNNSFEENPYDNEVKANEIIKQFDNNPEDLTVLSGAVKNLAQTQAGSRFLQKQLTKGSPEFVEYVLKEIESYLAELMTNDYGNYFCQRLLSSCSTSQRLIFVTEIKGKITTIAKDSKGIHTIQAIFDVMTMEEEEIIIASDLKDHIFELAMVIDIFNNV